MVKLWFNSGLVVPETARDWLKCCCIYTCLNVYKWVDGYGIGSKTSERTSAISTGANNNAISCKWVGLDGLQVGRASENLIRC